MTEATRDGRGRYTRCPDTAASDAQAAALRAQGATYQAIADQLGMGHRGDAHKAVQRALSATLKEPTEALRLLEGERLDRLTEQAWEVLERRHVVVSNGRVVRRQVGTRTADDGTEHPVYEELLDDGPVLAAIDRLLKISERRAKLYGLDAPTKVQAFTMDAIDAEIARLNAEMGALDLMNDEERSRPHG